MIQLVYVGMLMLDHSQGPAVTRPPKLPSAASWALDSYYTRNCTLTMAFWLNYTLPFLERLSDTLLLRSFDLGLSIGPT